VIIITNKKMGTIFAKKRETALKLARQRAKSIGYIVTKIKFISKLKYMGGKSWVWYCSKRKSKTIKKYAIQ